MANQTVKDAIYIKGTNPQYLVEKIIRTRIYDCRYWKEECFALTAELLVDKAMELKSLGGVYGGTVRPTPFICLILKMLQIQPEKEIIIEFIRNEDFKYVRALGAFYMRLTGTSIDVYKYLEPLYIDYRKMKRMNKNAKYELIHMDEFIDELINGERVCDVALPRIQKRNILEELNDLEPRISPLDVNLDDVESSATEASSESEDESEKEDKQQKKHHKSSKENESCKKSKETSSKKVTSPHQSSKEKSRFRYTDYDNPDPEEDTIKRYKRSPSPRYSSSSKSNRTRRSRTRSRSRRRDRSRGDRSREREQRRDRSRDRSRDRKRKSDNERENKSRNKDTSDRGRDSERKKEKSRIRNSRSKSS